MESWYKSLITKIPVFLLLGCSIVSASGETSETLLIEDINLGKVTFLSSVEDSECVFDTTLLKAELDQFFEKVSLRELDKLRTILHQDHPFVLKNMNVPAIKVVSPQEIMWYFPLKTNSRWAFIQEKQSIIAYERLDNFSFVCEN